MPKMHTESTAKKKDFIAQAAELAAARIHEDLEEASGGEASAVTDEILHSDEEETPVDEALRFDIFDHIQTNFAAKGEGVKYLIYRDNELLTTKRHPYSWEKLQEDLGGGNYRVQAKSMTLGSFIKQQHKMVADPPGTRSSNDEESTENTSKASSNGLAEILLAMQQSNERREQMSEQLRREQVQMQKESRNELFTLVTGLATALSPVLAKVFEKREDPRSGGIDPVVQLMFDTMKDQSRDSNIRVEKLLEKIEHANESSKRETGPSPLELIKLQQDAEDRGYARHREMMETAEEKASERAEELAAAKTGEKQSLIEKVITGMLPAIAGNLTGQPVATQPRLPVIPSKPIQPKPVINAAPKPIVPPTPKKEEPPMPMSPELKRVLDVILPPIQIGLMKRSKEEDVSSNIKKVLTDAGISLPECLKQFTPTVIDDLVRYYGLPKMVKPWLNSIYAHLNRPEVLDADTGSNSVTPVEPVRSDS